jgi:hypothetical protein
MLFSSPYLFRRQLAPYIGPAEATHCSKIRFNNLDHINDMDGLSGSPVFQFKPVSENAYYETFAGVLIQGTKESKIGRFIDAPVVYKALSLITPS